MISIGSIDGRKGLGFVVVGVGGGGRDMEETELEEGEACSFHNNDDYDAIIDPDIALSYIDEKLQDVLGHFQKDFEGGVSAENLGAKFGGYGSFLPSYQRSPVWPHPKTPPKVQNGNIPRSPKDLQLEGGYGNTTVSSTASQTVRVGPTSTCIPPLPALKAASIDDAVKNDVCMPSSCHAEEFFPRHDTNKRSDNFPDQKMLKVRIKVGSDNLSTRKNAAIYSGLGLDVSPSSSLDDSPSESDGIPNKPQDAPFESPSVILQIMTSSPLRGNALLSPLPNILIYLTEKEKLPNGCVPDRRALVESSSILVNGSDSVKGDEKPTGVKKSKLVERNEFSVESKSGSGKVARNGIGFISKEVDVGTLACEELVSNSLKFPLPSNSYSAVDDAAKGHNRTSNKEGYKGVVRDKLSLDRAKAELDPIPSQEVGFTENPKVGSSGKVWEDKKLSSLNDVSVNSGKDGHRKGEKTYDTKGDSNVPKGRKSLDADVVDTPKPKASQKPTSYEQDGVKLPPGKELLSSGGKKKSKGSQNNGSLAAEDPKEIAKSGSSLVSKNKKSSNVDNHTRRKHEDLKVENDIGKVGETDRDFLGDIAVLEKEENILNPSDMRSEDRLKDFEFVGKGTSAISNASKERSSGRNIDKLSTSEVFPKLASNIDSRSENQPISDAAPASVIHENWVCCDKCQRWRLLPVGLNPDNLPEKWLCNMLNWLPGMNRCSISEEETTKAVILLCQVPAPDSQSFGLPAMPIGGKKKHVYKETSNETYKDAPMKFSNSVKNVQASVRSGSLNDVHHSPLVSEPDFQQLNNSSDLDAEKHKHKRKEKHKVFEHHSDGGDIKKMKSKKDPDQDSLRASKKIKTEDLHFTDEDWMSDHGTMEKVGPSSSSGLPATSTGKGRPKYNTHLSLKDSKYDTKDRMQVFAKKTKDKVQASLNERSLDMGNGDFSKKRKAEDSQIPLGSLPGTEHHLQESKVFVKEESSENVHRNEKKVRMSKSEGKESSGSKGNGRTEKKCGYTKDYKLVQDLGSSLSQRSLDGMDSLKKEFGSSQPAVAATSSSSKVSGSHKTNVHIQELKGSPVESVSSSPMRTPNPDKLPSARRNSGKDDSHEVGLYVIGSPRRCSDGDDGGSERSGTARKENTSTVAHHMSLESSVSNFQDKDFSHLTGSKAKAQIAPSHDTTDHHFTNGDADYLDKDNRYPSKPTQEERQNNSHYHGSRTMKSGKGSSSRSKDKNRNFKSESELGSSSRSKDKNRKFKSESELGKIKSSDCINELQDRTPNAVRPRDSKSKFQEKFEVKSSEVDDRYVDKKDRTGRLSSESSLRETQCNFGGPDGSDVKVDATSGWGSMSTPKQNLQQDSNSERSSKRFLSDKTDRVEAVSGREKSQQLPPSGGQNESLARCPRPVSGSRKGSGADISANIVSDGDDASKMPKHNKKVDDQNGTQHGSTRHTPPNRQRVRDVDAPSPLRRDSSSQAATNALKEAKDLKHLADRLKNSESNLESTVLYFQAALKFLHGASLLESSSSESAKHGDLIQSLQIYRSTAKLCEFCAHEFEKSKDMAAAALAYKCTEVAYMRVVYSSHFSASRDRHELQTALQMVPPGESPSSSASDVDNLNHPMTVDKVPVSRGVSSPQITGNYVIAARNRPNLGRLLNFAHDVNSAMEASRKSRIALTAANVNVGESQHEEGTSSIKIALDFNFQDVEGLLRLVRLAMEAISR
ncbi:zf-CW domain-containing protein [Cephalotus follicularis]|uniref:Zf-CW domain-containing protein n=1 Tax=Cephalotus follicularis TaxID=3775 RepID=A0A1Q3CT65_CEPFO|nr:zf-CW domain-containing protein [Cephalotus follicularis]